MRPTPINKEISLDASKIIMSKTDAKGVIEYANDYFMEVCGYEEYELMGKPHSIIRHPDMPRTVFKLLWNRLKDGENIYALVKNLAKNGHYYWVLTSFETKFDKEGEIVSHYSRRKAAPPNAIYAIEKLYKTLLAIETQQGMPIAVKYFNGLLEERKMTYDDFILSVLNVDAKTLASYFTEGNKNYNIKKSEPKKGFLGRLFK